MNIRAKMYNRRAQGEKSKPNELIEGLDLKKGQSIADIGSGGGYFSFHFAQAVGKSGKVFAVDVNRSALNYIRKESISMGLSNLQAIAAADFFSKVPTGSLDIVFLRNVYHHLDDPAKYFAEMKLYLKPDGEVVIIDYRADGRGFSFHKLFKHSVTPKEVADDMIAAGYVSERSFDFLPEQYFMVFKSAKGDCCVRQ